MKTLIACLLLAPALLLAQPAPSASAPGLVITPETACGAPGVGIAGATGLPERRDVVPPTKRVSKGHWVTDPACSAAPAAKDCPPQPAPTYWQFKGSLCVPAPGAMLPGRNVSPADVTVFSDGYQLAKPPKNRNKGTLTYECQRDPEGATAWVLINQHCR